MPIKKKIICFIFARKNSKRLPKKNTLKIGKLMLIEHTILSAIKSKVFNKIILSSDDEKILNLSKKYKIIDFIKRPKNLSGDYVKNIDVLNFYVKKLDIRKEYDYLSLLLPTCPFRNYKHIKLGVKKLFDNKNVDVVLSASETNFPIQFALKKRGDFISPFFDNSPLTKNKTRSQNQQKTYFPNGGFWMSKTKTFLRNKSFYRGKLKMVEMSKTESIDIDDLFDFNLAKFIYSNY